ncbi:efflux RND transporter periplasmic adaptor subunit [Rhodobacter ferrooxidans]|uniref:Efflux transporter, RND family, MFP subunit n=1 Tax=Rhodobacter ferrooxidans TaxID=371731 RepID=C8RX16_9RHOB|nr:efflux RND transporter periplasmic adaptor subunit [Rhodobacter sp. SW2]EEW26541.1 efflux transporter, RND family, MFP subunit [Rhodobacter sp. SW2]
MMRLPIAAVLSLLALPVFAQTEIPPAAPVLPAITVSTVGSALLRDRVLASGLVGPVEQVQVQPLIEGQPIQTLAADVGDTVAAGQVLAVLSGTALDLQKSQFLASLAAARATIAQAEAQLLEATSSADEAQRVNVRTAKLKEQGSASQAAADQAQAAAISATARVSVATQSLEAARAQLALVQAQLDNVELQRSRTQVVAPVAGEVIARNAQVGSVASAAGSPMFVLIRDGALELRADIAERDLLRLVPGQTATMQAVGSDEPLTGTVRLVEPSIDTVTRLGRARISIDAPDRLRDGMFVDAEILVAERQALAVPVTAVGSSAEGATVMRVQQGQVSRVPVVTGIRDAGLVEIVSGLAAGDLVVTKAAAFVRDGDRVNPVPAPMTN